jgi:hypothetical protein
MRWLLFGSGVLLSLWAASPQLAAQIRSTGREPVRPYIVQCREEPNALGARCVVDRSTYVGWRAFHMVCHRCHAEDGVGSSFAPSLVERVRKLSKGDFLLAMENGYPGLQGALPPWGRDRDVNRYYDELWSYLLARANGDLPPGKPGQLPASD